MGEQSVNPWRPPIDERGLLDELAPIVAVLVFVLVLVSVVCAIEWYLGG